MKNIGWAVFYEDGSYTSKNINFESLPRDGVLCMAVFEDRLTPNGYHQRALYQAYDYYFRAEGRRGFIYGCVNEARERDTLKDIQDRYKNPIILRGKWTDRETLEIALEAMRGYQFTTD